MRSFTIYLSGHRYQAAWIERGADQVEVRSDYGRTLARLNGEQPEIIARTVLARLVRNASLRN